jgi:hypothetical protein
MVLAQRGDARRREERDDLAANDAVAVAEKAPGVVESDAKFLDEKTIPTLMVAWTTEYTKLHAALIAAWVLDSARVERCFKPFRKASKKKAAKDAPEAAEGRSRRRYDPSTSPVHGLSRILFPRRGLPPTQSHA